MISGDLQCVFCTAFILLLILRGVMNANPYNEALAIATDSQKCSLYIVQYRKCPRALTFQNVVYSAHCRHRFSKVLLTFC